MLYTIIVGGVAGWLAGLIIKGGGSGIIVNVILGIVGAFVSHLIFSQIGGGMLGLRAGSLAFDLVTSTIGAVIILVIAGVLSR